MRMTLILALSAIFGLTAHAEKQALVGGTLLDGLGGAPIYDSVILVEDDKIIDVGTQDSLPVPDGYRIISTCLLYTSPSPRDRG